MSSAGVAKRSFLTVVLVAAFGSLAGALVWTAPERDPGLRERPPAHVEVTEVVRRDLQPSARVTGRLQPARRARLHFELAGQVNARTVEPGQRVEAGTVLLRLAAGDYRDATAEARAQLALERHRLSRDERLLRLAERNRELQQKEVSRLERLGRSSLSSQSQLDTARQRLLELSAEAARLRHDVETGQARIRLREAELARAERNLARTRLTAPFDGTVNGVSVEVGDYVTPNQPVAELVELSALDLFVEVRGEVAAALAIGDAVRVQVDDTDVEGRVVALERSPSTRTFTHALRVRVPGGAGRAGQVAEATIELDRLEGRMIVPGTAVLREAGRSFVFVVTDGRLRRTPVRLGRRVDGEQVIEAGVEAGAVVVARDVAALSDGQPVVTQAPAPPGRG